MTQSRRDRGATRTNPSAAKHLPPGKVLAGRFRLDEILGVGGMGVVYAAHDQELNLPVAVKLLRPEMADDGRLQERFRREIILARQVSHRNVVRIHDLFQDDDLRFLTMDLVRGRSLRDVLRSDGPLTTVQAIDLTLQLARALEAAHEHGVVHRDLKPENVLVEDGGPAGGLVARISDFGIARSLGAELQGGLTATGTVVGSLEYLSPEQARGGDLDGRSDVYSLGLILHEMLTGRLPFRRGSDMELLAQRLSASPSMARLEEAPTQVPGWLRKVLARMLQRDPAHRYDAACVVRDLEARSYGGGAPRPAGRWLGLAALALVAVVALGIWGVMSRKDPTMAGAPPGERTAGADEAAASGGVGIEGQVESPKHSVAVLPLVDRTGRGELAWTSRGGAEMLAQSLAESRDLRVVDSLRVFRLLEDLGFHDVASGGTVQGLSERRRDELAQLLDVDYVVTGVLHPSGEGLRLELRLSRTGPGGETRTLTGPDDPGPDLAASIPELAQEVRRALEVRPGSADAPSAERASDAARAAYDQGVEQLLAGKASEAADLLDQAVADSPGFVGAWIRLSDALEQQGRIDEALEALRQGARKAGQGDAASGRRALEIAAREADLRGDAEHAQELWRRLVERYPQDVEARMHLATAYGEAGSLDEARAVLHEVVAVDSKHPRAWYLLSKYAIQDGDLNRAVDEYLVHALVIQNQLDNDQGRADVLNAMGVAYDRLGRIDLAERRYTEAAGLRREVGDLRGYAASLRNLGALAAVRGDFQAAEGHYDKAAEVLDELGDRYGAASLASRRGLLEEEKGNYRGALEFYRQALQMRRDLGDKRVLAESYNNVGYAYFLLGDYDNAGVYWHQALDEVAAEGNRQGEIFVRQSLGLLHMTQGRWDEAARFFLETLKMGREVEVPDAQAAALGYLGRLAHLQGRYAAAFDSYGQALEILGELSDPRGLAEFGLLRAEALYEIGDDDGADAALGGVRSALAEADNREQSASLRMLAARLALRRGDLASAEDLARRARADAEASHSVVARWKSRLLSADLELASGRTAAAASTLEELSAEADALGHAELRLLAAGSLGDSLLAAGRGAEAREAFEAGLRVLPSAGDYAGAYRLHLGVATSSDETQTAETQPADAQSAEAESARTRAREEIERLLAEMDETHRTSFRELAEVAKLVD